MNTSAKGEGIRMERRVRPRIIGGIFGLEEVQGVKSYTPPFLNGRDIFLVNARSGLMLLVELLSPGQVWMPSYVCGSMLQAVDGSVTRVRFYEVNYDLSITSMKWIKNIQRGDLVILIDYFGFSCESSYTIRAREQGAWVLEDACQALLSQDVGKNSDFVLFSPRKFLGIPDGGILTVNSGLNFDEVILQSPPADWHLKALFATILRREFDIHGGERRWFELFQETENECPVGRFAMSELSKALLMNSFDYSTIAERRIENYQFLMDELGDLSLFPKLFPGVVPMGFPIHVKNRDQVRRMLFDHGIYPPVHWPIQGIVPEGFRESHKLADEIMTLPCDQRYSNRDMSRMTQLVLKEVGR